MSAYLIPLLVILVGSLLTAIVDRAIGTSLDQGKYTFFQIAVHKTMYIFYGGALVWSIQFVL